MCGIKPDCSTTSSVRRACQFLIIRARATLNTNSLLSFEIDTFLVDCRYPI